MAQLNTFNGGLNTRLAPHLINANEAVEYTNVDNTSMSLRPVKSSTNENTSIGKYFINFKGSWVSSSTYKDYVIFQDDLYFSDGVSRPQWTSDGTNWLTLGVDRPTSAPTVEEDDYSGGFNGTYQFCYTYYNSSTGLESQPSDYSELITVTDKRITIKDMLGTDQPGIDKIRVYRVGGNLTEMSMCDEADNPGDGYSVAVNTGIPDTDILGVLDSYNNAPAPTGLNYLTESNAMLFGSIGNKLYFSDIAFVEYWSDFNYIKFDNDITGIGATANGLLVFTKYKTYIVTGTSPLTLSKYLLSSNQGCLSHSSISFAKDTLIWASSDGICASDGGIIQVASRDKMGKLEITSIFDSIVFDDVYYLAYGNHILALDTRFGNILRIISQPIDKFSIHNDTLYYSLSGSLYSLLTSSSNMSMSYRSPLILDKPNYKSLYYNFKVEYIGSVTISVIIDGTTVVTKSLSSTTRTTVEILEVEEHIGYNLEFTVTGTGEVFFVDYRTLDKDNIAGALKFYSTTEFKEIVKVNNQPIEFNKTVDGYKSGNINIDPTNLSMFDNLKVKFQGSVEFRVYLDGVMYSKTLSSSSLVEEIIEFQDLTGYSLVFEVIGTGKVYDITFDSYNKSNIAGALKFYSTTEFKEIVKVNNQPIEFNKTSTGYKSGTIPFNITNHKMFKNLMICYTGSIDIKIYLDNTEVLNKSLSSTELEVKEILLPSSISRAYYIIIEYSGTGKLYDVEMVPLERQTNGR